MKDLLMHYGVTLGKRYSYKQKEFFLNYIIKICQENNVNYELITENRRLIKTTNLVIGDIDKSKKIVMAYYDTPQRYLFTNYRYFPFNPSENVRQEKNRFILKIIMTVMFIGLLIMGNYLNECFTIISRNLWYVFAGIICFIFYLIIRPKGNDVNFNANSAAVAVIMGAIDKTKNKNFSLVLYDRGSTGYDGLKLMNDRIKKDSEILILDGISCGEKVAFAHKNMSINEYICDGWIDKSYQNAHNALYFFNHCSMISCGKIVNHQFVVEPTRNRKDYSINMEQLNQINEVVHRFIEGS
ncbi:MAG: hypothetical protein MR210_00135 [Erysipelotrichaceae bacterium]|nr:hypothetical protein [Erysipelotrichaceae bacterium]MDY5252934.1 hypothetical protein [Erysipelotrichaceae bacterium]